MTTGFTSRLRNPVTLAGLAVTAVVVLTIVLVWFQPQKLFIDDVIDEQLPFDGTGTPSATGGQPVPADTADAAGDEAGDPPTVEESPVTPTLTTLAAGTFVDRSHPTSGTATVITDGSRKVLRLEDLRTDNGPDLYVYLVSASADAPADEIAADFVDLGRLKGNVGDQNYDLPDDVDLERYRTVLIWCDRFSVAFGAADLMVAG